MQPPGQHIAPVECNNLLVLIQALGNNPGHALTMGCRPEAYAHLYGQERIGLDFSGFARIGSGNVAPGG